METGVLQSPVSRVIGPASHLCWRDQGRSHLPCWPPQCSSIQWDCSFSHDLQGGNINTYTPNSENCFLEPWSCLRDWFPFLSVLTWSFLSRLSSDLLSASSVWEYFSKCRYLNVLSLLTSLIRKDKIITGHSPWQWTKISWEDQRWHGPTQYTA